MLGDDRKRTADVDVSDLGKADTGRSDDGQLVCSSGTRMVLFDVMSAFTHI